ncbi:uncharacterized protein LOC124687162 [Lolium rigidum]|uniref:uncharacterized protein LOC124687162 n=1 Tax=Lolium rigidum TaxID=89674 RepID=UPI001F5C210E|nr:uncharacterized protein LOC124687162 [Lolium rigidum]
MDSGSPVMTESERRAYRYAQAPRVQGVQGLGVRKSWSNDSLFSLVGSQTTVTVHSCVCAPTTHPGSFRCKHHRQNQNAYQIGGAGQSTADADADVKRGDEAHQEASPSAEQEKAS